MENNPKFGFEKFKKFKKFKKIKKIKKVFDCLSAVKPQKDNRHYHYHYILLVIILVIGITVRFWALGEKSLWIDEIYSYIFSSQKTLAISFNYMFADLSPPIYYLILYFFVKLFGSSAFGVSEFILRLPSFLAGVASIFAVYFLAKKNFNKDIALGAMILTAFSPVLLYYSQEARPYSLFALFSIITLFFWIEIIKKIQKAEALDTKTLIKYTISSLLTIFTHYWGLVFVFFQILYLFIFLFLTKKRNMKSMKSMKNLVISALIIFYFSVVYLVSQYWFLLAGIFNLKGFSTNINVNININNLNPFMQIFNQIFYNSYVFLLLLISLFLLNINKLFSNKSFKTFITEEITVNKLASPVIFLTYIIILPVCVYLILYKITYLIHPRHLIFIAPFTYVLISYIVFSLEQKKELKKEIFKTIFLFCLCSIFLGIFLFVPQKIQNIQGRTFTYYNKPKQEWRESTKYIIDHSDKNSIILIYGTENFFDYYLKKLHKNNKKLHINSVFDENFIYKKNFSKEIKYYRKKYKKVYFYSVAIMDMRIKNIKNAMETAKPSCPHLERKNFVNINLYECY